MDPSRSFAHRSTGQQALGQLVDARALRATFEGLQARLANLAQRLDKTLVEADWRAREALRTIDELARSDPGQLGPSLKKPGSDCWDTVVHATQQTCELEADAERLAPVPLERPSRNGGPA